MLCHYADCQYVECRVLFIILLNVILLSVVVPVAKLDEEMGTNILDWMRAKLGEEDGTGRDGTGATLVVGVEANVG